MGVPSSKYLGSDRSRRISRRTCIKVDKSVPQNHLVNLRIDRQRCLGSDRSRRISRRTCSKVDKSVPPNYHVNLRIDRQAWGPTEAAASPAKLAQMLTDQYRPFVNLRIDRQDPFCQLKNRPSSFLIDAWGPTEAAASPAGPARRSEVDGFPKVDGSLKLTDFPLSLT